MKLSVFFALSLVALLPLAAQQTIDNLAVIKMTKGHLPEPVILKMIATQPTQFEFNPERMIELTQAGVSENVIAAMLNRAGDSTAATQLPAAPITQPVAASPPPSSQGGTKIPAGLEIQLRVLTALNSKTAQQDDPVEMEVAENVKVGGQVVIPQGSKAMGYVVGATSQAAFAVAGRLTVVAKYVEAPDGSKIAVFGRLGANQSFSVNKKVFIPGYGVFARGKGAKVTEGTTILAHTLGSPQ